MTCKTNKDLSQSPVVKDLVDKIIDKNKNSPFFAIIISTINSIVEKFTTGKEFTDDEKIVIEKLSVTINLCNYIDKELLDNLMDRSNIYIKSGQGGQHKNIYIDSEKIIDNQEKSKKNLDSEYIVELLKDNTLSPSNRKRLEIIHFYLEKCKRSEDSKLYQGDIQIKDGMFSIRGVYLPNDTQRSYNNTLHHNEQSLYIVLGFIARIMGIDTNLKDLLGNKKDNLEEIGGMIDSLYGRTDIDQQDQEELIKLTNQYKTLIRQISDKFIENGSVNIDKEGENKDKMNVGNVTILDILQELIGVQCVIPYMKSYKDHSIYISLFHTKKITFTEDKEIGEYYRFK